MPIEDTLISARSELESGRKWRAKEIIRSSLGNYGYQLELYQLYGEVLLSMKDLQQAGKYLFFSKEKLNEEERNAVGIYVERHGKDGYEGLLKGARQIHYKKLSQFPGFVQERLTELGAKENLYGYIETFKSGNSNGRENHVVDNVM